MWHFQTDFRVWKLFCLDSNFTEICSLRFNGQCASFGSDNDLAPNRWQDIMWTNGDKNQSLVPYGVTKPLSPNIKSTFGKHAGPLFTNLV